MRTQTQDAVIETRVQESDIPTQTQDAVITTLEQESDDRKYSDFLKLEEKKALRRQMSNK